jgi:16S rRNA (adenine1518-N6/adenine1519-N6)-dimethyltransferase
MGYSVLPLAASRKYRVDPPLSFPRLDIQQLLRQYGLHPDKSLGQNFLLDEAALGKVASAAEINPDEVVLEVGAGMGSLTRHLAVVAHRVVAVELDGRLIPALKQVVGYYDNVEVIQGDILTLNVTELINDSRYLVVANIPYYITSNLIRHLLEVDIPPQRLVLTLQQEVARRICAQPGDMSLLALSVQVYGVPKIVAHIPAEAFFPPPKVDSSILRIDIYATPLIHTSDLDVFFMLIKAGFSQKRKTLRNSLAGGLHLPPRAVETLLLNARIDPKRRAETLNLTEWHQLAAIYKSGYAKEYAQLSSP